MSDEQQEDERIAKVSDYLDGLLSGAAKDEVAQKIASDPAWKQTHDEMVAVRDEVVETRKALSGLQKARASPKFAEDVTETIHKRSAGRFFGRRTFGDRIPLMPLVILAVLGLCAIAYLMWASETGSLKVEHHDSAAPGSAVDLKPRL
jgi:anti-sigma factor RsiW